MITEIAKILGVVRSHEDIDLLHESGVIDNLTMVVSHNAFSNAKKLATTYMVEFWKIFESFKKDGIYDKNAIRAVVIERFESLNNDELAKDMLMYFDGFVSGDDVLSLVLFRISENIELYFNKERFGEMVDDLRSKTV